MNQIELILKERIRTEGALPVSEFMALAQMHPAYGYYRNSKPLGADGDFITAPEVSQVFGELIGLWLAVMWKKTGSPKKINLIELGPGRGTMMADMLRAAESVPAFFNAVSVHLVESNRQLRSSQKKALEKFDTKLSIQWYDSLDCIPPDGPTLLAANEFFDALPIDQYVLCEEGWRLRCVDLSNNGTLIFVEKKPKNYVGALIPEDIRDNSKLGTVFEVCREAISLMKLLSKRLVSEGGAAIILDYGHNKRSAGDTLQAVKNHKYCNILEYLGECDLSSHVDFFALTEALKSSELNIYGPVYQGTFLRHLGIIERTEQLAQLMSREQALELRKSAHRLISSTQMGKLFKVITLNSQTK
ncbi:MAG: methyltransferase [Rhodospirillaceae bacterium]|nr:methyltransferase [Rhodospirillaceae bacterium]